MALFNLARMTVSSSGTGNITLNTAVSGFLTFDLAGCSTAATGQSLTYAIADTTQSEIATGTYYSSGPTLVRGSSIGPSGGMKSTNGNSPINMSNAAQVFIAPQAQGLLGKVNTQFFTANGTYTPTTGLISAVIECVGGGAGGGGVRGSSTGVCGGGAGGGGGYSRSVKTSSQIGTSQAVTIGAAGTGSAAANGTGGTVTSVGVLVIANGGNGGTEYGNVGIGVGGAGAAAGTGDIAIAGQRGMDGIGLLASGVINSLARGPNGANSFYGAGGAGPVAAATAAAAGGNATGYGAGGAGGTVSTSTADIAGGNGSAGIAIITEFCSL